MATSSMVPYSNPAGNNQTNPSLLKASASPILTVPTSNPLTSPLATAQTNPLIPTGAVTAPISSTSVTGTPTTGGTQLTPNAANAINPSTYNQLVDIYGGVGQELGAFEGSIAGTNSATLQEYINSLAPQEATSQANLSASLGAGGVSPNSSVAALGESNLQAQEFAQISGESANLTQSQQDLEAQLIESTLPSAQKQVADSSPWNILGNVLGDIGSAVSDVTGLGGITSLFSHGGSSSNSLPFGGADTTNEDTLLESLNTIGIPQGAS